ncbi:hypothetical protein [Streptomyces sp.]|uniref:hypothetical protein n=1 Tax=Streptomyces sp. TaxID=1931 RepID=UPI002F3FE4D8
MRSARPLPLALAGAALFALPPLSACGGSDTGSSGNETAVAATRTACEVARTELHSGETAFAVTNRGGRVTEVYVHGEHDTEYTKVVGEVENTGPAPPARRIQHAP